MTKLEHYDHLGTVRFITIGCRRDLQLLTDIKIIKIFLEELDKIRYEYSIKIFGYVIMPEHVHMVLFPQSEIKLGVIIGRLKALSARRILAYLKAIEHPFLYKLISSQSNSGFSFWKYRCYDHNCRSFEKVIAKINYCHKNPVTRGLVDSPEKWQWSSFNWYNGFENVPFKVDSFEECHGL